MEANKISDEDDLKSRYQALNKKLKHIEDKTNREIQESLGKGLKKISGTTYLPKDLATYLLSLKREFELPISVLPSSLFERPAFLGRENFFQRLASELIAFGMAYQRVYLEPIRLSQLAFLFHKHRPWWQCNIQDIEKAIETLIENSIVEKTEAGLLFEPLTMSNEVQDFLNFINHGISSNGEISLSLVKQLVPWDNLKIEAVIDLLSSNKVCIFDKNEEMIYFPEFNRGS